MKLLKLLCTLSLCAISYVNGMHYTQESKENPYSTNEYRSFNGTEITGETIGSLAQQYPLPEEHTQVVTEWRDSNRELLANLCDFSCQNSKVKEQFQKCKDLLNKANLKNLSRHSYIFSLPNNNNLFAQISGPLFRLWNLDGADCYVKKTDEELDSFDKQKTYQTISRFAYYLRYLEEAEKNNLNNVVIPKTYLVPLKDNQQTNDYSDDNCFIVQEALPEGCSPLRENKNRIADIPSTSLQEYLSIINAIGLWDTSANTLITKDNNPVISDIEQPANEEPEHFFHKNTVLYENQIKTGLQELFEICESSKETQRAIQDFARNKVNFIHPANQKALESDLHLNE